GHAPGRGQPTPKTAPGAGCVERCAACPCMTSIPAACPPLSPTAVVHSLTAASFGHHGGFGPLGPGLSLSLQRLGAADGDRAADSPRRACAHLCRRPAA